MRSALCKLALIVSGFAVMIYMKMDQLMLGSMVGADAVGIYSAAVKLSEVWYFVPLAVISSTFPILLKTRQEDPAFYHRRIKRLYRSMLLLAVAVAVPMTFLSGILVPLLFGETYASAGPVLAIHIWGGTFVVMGLVGGEWLVGENLQKFTLYRTLSGAVLNICLNLVLIPRFGPTGAAVATVVSQSWAGFWFDLLHPKTRPSFRLKLQSLLFR